MNSWMDFMEINRHSFTPFWIGMVLLVLQLLLVLLAFWLVL